MDKPMRFAVKAAAEGREAYDESPCDYTVPGQEESQRLVALAIQEAAEPLLVVARIAEEISKPITIAEGREIMARLTNALPAALKAMEVSDD